MIFISREDLAKSMVSSPFCIVAGVYIYRNSKWCGIACGQSEECYCQLLTCEVVLYPKVVINALCIAFVSYSVGEEIACFGIWTRVPVP
jgi:hypothetical protein